MLYTGSISKPGIISRIVIEPIQLKKRIQKAMPAKSSTSPYSGAAMKGTR
jgi:hypothetical protein